MIKKIKQIYNNLIEKNKTRQKQKEIFKNAQNGDMLWCNMPLTRKELKWVEESHRTRPYLIVKKESNFLLCYQSSSKKREKFNNYEQYCISSVKYKNKKDSWIDLTSIKRIEIKDIKSEYIKINQIDVKKIEKRICIEQSRGNSELIRFNEPIYIEIGDVISKGNNSYYIYAEDNVNVYGFKIQKRKNENEKLEKIKINRKTYYTNFKELRTINRNEEFEIINIAYKEEILEILEKRHELKANTYSGINEDLKKINNKFDIGAIFEYGNSKVMYLYFEKGKYYGVDLLWYQIKPRIFEIKQIQKRKLLGMKKLEEINKILEVLEEKKMQNNKVKKIHQYVRNMLFSSVA